MKVRIKHFNGELPDYLTVGKVYNSLAMVGLGCNIVDDDQEAINIIIDDCAFLNGGSWEIVEE